MWAKVHEVDKEYKNHQINLYMDKPSWELFHRAGTQLKTKKNEDGEAFVTFRRDPAQVDFNGRPYGKPLVLGEDGEVTSENIGNGSEVAVTIAVYDTKRGKGHRFEKVEVLKLVPYNGGVEDARAPAVAVDSTDTSSGDTKTRVKGKEKPSVAIEDDGFPF
jgi:hypothetical protein